MRDNVELNRLGQRTALPNSHNITLLHRKARTAMSMNVLVTLLKTTVLGNVMKVIPTNDNGPLHFGRNDQSLEDLSTNGDISRKRTLLVNVVALNGGIGGFDTETNVLDPTHGLDLFGVDAAFAGYENGILRLVGLFVLYRVPPPHELSSVRDVGGTSD